MPAQHNNLKQVAITERKRKITERWNISRNILVSDNFLKLVVGNVWKPPAWRKAFGAEQWEQPSWTNPPVAEEMFGNPQLGKKPLELRNGNNIREYIRQLLRDVHIVGLNDPCFDLILHKMTINLYVFCTFVKQGLATIYNATWLSYLRETGPRCLTSRSIKRLNNQVTSQQVITIDLYSTSTEERENHTLLLRFPWNWRAA